jgi:hypothetical protein
MNISKYEVIHINSKDRTSGTPSNFNITIDYDDEAKYTHISVINFSLPKSFYIYNSATFQLVEDITTYNVSMDDGNISRRAFANYIQDLLNATGSYTYTVNFPNKTGLPDEVDDGKFTFGVSGNSGNTVKLIFDSNEQPAHSFGFETGSTNSFTSSIKSTRPVNFQASSNNVYIVSNLINSRNKNTFANNILTSYDASFSSLSVYNLDIIYNSRRLNKTKHANFSLIDDNDDAIDLNGIEWTLTILLYRVEDFTAKINNIGKLLVSINSNLEKLIELNIRK